MAGSLSGATFRFFTYTDNGSDITITGYPTTGVGTVTIPATIIGKPVTTIGDSAFSYCSVTIVNIPSSVKTIGNQAFFGSGLAYVNIPASVTSIGTSAFAMVQWITSFSVENGNPNYSSVDGVLFDKARNTLIQYPAGKSGTYYTIPSSVTSIGSYAFAICKFLVIPTIPSSVTSIGDSAFYSSNFARVSIPSSVTSIGNNAFDACSNLVDVTIPASVTSIGKSAFFSCGKLTSAEFLGNAPTIGTGVFAYAASGFTVKYHNGTTGFTSPTWKGYTSVNTGPILTGSLQANISPTEAVIAGVQWRVDGGPWQASAATISGLYQGTHTVSFSTVDGWSTPTTVMVEVNDSQITTITGTSVARLGSLQVNITPQEALVAGAQWRVDGGAWQQGTTISGVFQGNHTVSFNTVDGWTTPADVAVVVNDNQTTMTTGAYVLQTGALKVTIGPAAVVSAGAQWQVDGGTWQTSGTTNSGLAVGSHTVSFKAVSGWIISNVPATVNFNQTTAITSTYLQTGSVTVHLEPLAAANAGARWRVDGGTWQYNNAYVNNLAPGTHTVSFQAMTGWNAPPDVSVMISSNQIAALTGTYSALLYSYADNGTYISITGYPTYLTGAIEIPPIINGKPVASIGNAAFQNCSGLTSVSIPTSVISIGTSAFQGCTGLTSMSIPSSVTTIGDWAFYNCSNLETVTIPESVITIGAYAFQGCTGLTTVTIPSSVTSIGAWTFYNCSGLTSATVSLGVTIIADSMFQACTGLTSINIPESVTTIGQQAFAFCSALTSVTIPIELNSLGINAFIYCSGLTDIIIPPV
ncbi:MAG: leucine-rich repeat domain-containing protein [Terrimicrobiaceae bacterium]